MQRKSHNFSPKDDGRRGKKIKTSVIDLTEEFDIPFPEGEILENPPLTPNTLNQIIGTLDGDQNPPFQGEFELDLLQDQEISPVKIDGGEIKLQYSVQNKILSISLWLSYDDPVAESYIPIQISNFQAIIHGRLVNLRKERKAAFVTDQKLNEENIKNWIGIIKIFNVAVQADQIFLIEKELHEFISLLIQERKFSFHKKDLAARFDKFYNPITKPDEFLVQNFSTSITDQNPSIQTESIESQSIIGVFPQEELTVELRNEKPKDQFRCLLTPDKFLKVDIQGDQDCIESKLIDFRLTKMFPPVVISFYRNSKDGYGEMIFHNLLFDSSELAFIQNEISGFIMECLRNTNKERITLSLKEFLDAVNYQNKLMESIKLPETEYSTIKHKEDQIKLIYSIQNNNTLAISMVFADKPSKDSKETIVKKLHGKLFVLKNQNLINFGKKTKKIDSDPATINTIVIYNVSLQSDQFHLIEKDLYFFIDSILNSDKVPGKKITEDFHKFYDRIKMPKEGSAITTQESTAMNSQESTAISQESISVIAEKSARRSHRARLFSKPKTKKFEFNGKKIEVNYEVDINSQLRIKFVINNIPDRKKLINRIEEIDTYDLLYQEEFNTRNVSVIVPVQISGRELASEQVLAKIHNLSELILGKSSADRENIPSVNEVNDAVNQLITVLLEPEIIKDLQGSSEKLAGLQLSNENFLLK